MQRYMKTNPLFRSYTFIKMLEVVKKYNFHPVAVERHTQKYVENLDKENEQGRKVEDISRELGINPGTFYNWRKKYSGMEASQLKELKELQSENNKLKRMYAEQALQITMLKDVIGKKW